MRFVLTTWAVVLAWWIVFGAIAAVNEPLALSWWAGTAIVLLLIGYRRHWRPA
jgi:hypothetical protein